MDIIRIAARARPGRGSFASILALLLCLVVPRGGEAQEVRARVVDEPSRSAVVGAAATLLAADSGVVDQAASGSDGFFMLSAGRSGEFLVRVEHPGYATVTRSVVLGEALSTIPAFVLSVAAIRLDTLSAEADRRSVAAGAVERPVGRSADVIAGERLAELEKSGISFPSVVRELGGSVRVRSVMVGERSYPCVESGRGPVSFRGGRSETCNLVAIVIDGLDTGLGQDPGSMREALRFIESLDVADYESVEYLSSVRAGFRYGMHASAQGALVLWTRGSGPHRSEGRGGGT